MEKMNKNGFTLLELMIVIAIIAAMAAIGMPNFFAWLPERRLDAGAQDVLQGLQKARTRAIMTNRNTVVSYNIGADSFTAFVDDGQGVGGVAEDGVLNGTEEVIVSQNMPPSIDLISTGFTANTIAFDNRGIPLNNNVGLVTLQNGSGNNAVVQLYLTGHGTIIQ